MTGIAGAESVVVSPRGQQLSPSQTPPGDSFATYNIAMSQIIPGVNVHMIMATTTGVSLGGSTADLRYNFHYGTLSSGWIASGVTWTWTDSSTGTDSLTVDVMDTGSALNTKYQFKVDDSYPTDLGSDTAQATIYGVSIPEFPTVALPLGAAIGLVFFFHYRKKKEEQ